MAGESRVVNVEIFGQTYRLRADEDPTYVQTLADYVDGKMRDVARSATTVDSMRVAVLAALTIADEHLRAAKAAPAAGPAKKDAKAAEAAAALDRRATEWLRILDEALAG